MIVERGSFIGGIRLVVRFSQGRPLSVRPGCGNLPGGPWSAIRGGNAPCRLLPGYSGMMTGAPESLPDLPHKGSSGHRPDRWWSALRWGGRLYAGLGCVEAIGVVLGLFVGNGVFAIRCAGFGPAWLLLGGVLIGASRLDWPERSLTEMVPGRALSKDDAERSSRSPGPAAGSGRLRRSCSPSGVRRWSSGRADRIASRLSRLASQTRAARSPMRRRTSGGARTCPLSSGWRVSGTAGSTFS